MLKNTQKCNFNLVNMQKESKNIIKSENLFGLNFSKHNLYFLRYQDNHFILTIISQNRENGGFTHK